MDGHRVAFNRAFQDLGMDCVSWTPAIYHDLLAKGDGTGEGLVRAYYRCVGWPTFLPTSEQELFASKVYQVKQQQMKRLIKAQGVPLRDGVVQVLEQALAAGFRIALICETSSDPSDDVITSLLQQLPPGIAAEARVYSTSAYRQPLGASDSRDGDDEEEEQARGSGSGSGSGSSSGSSSSSASASLAAAAGRVKQKGAQEFVERLSAALSGKEAAVGVQIDPALQLPGRPASASAALLAAVSATLDVAAAQCLVVASSNDIVNAAAAAGMTAVAIPRKMAYTATFPLAAAKFESFGPGAATFSRLRSLLPVPQQQQQQQQ